MKNETGLEQESDDNREEYSEARPAMRKETHKCLLQYPLRTKTKNSNRNSKQAVQ